jgi:hypothetical protein
MEMFRNGGLFELYGSTEAGIVSNLRPPDMRRKDACVGPPWFMTQVRLEITALGPEAVLYGAGRLALLDPPAPES